MAPTTIPSPLPKWAKWAIALGATPTSPIVNLLTYLGTTTDSSDPAAGTWMHCQLVWDDVVSNQTADRMIVTIDVVNITSGHIDSSWTEDDFTTVDGHLGSILDNWSAIAQVGVNAREIRYYPRQFNPYGNAHPFTDGGPPIRVTPHAAMGSQTGQCGHQLALSTTEVTTYPKHWGRMYMPAPGCGGTVYTAGGRVSNVTVDSWATAISGIYADMMDDEFFPVVPTTTVNGVPSRSLLGVQAIQVDNVPDVIRRRRPFATTYRKLVPLPS